MEYRDTIDCPRCNAETVEVEVDVIHAHGRGPTEDYRVHMAHGDCPDCGWFAEEIRVEKVA